MCWFVLYVLNYFFLFLFLFLFIDDLIACKWDLWTGTNDFEFFVNETACFVQGTNAFTGGNGASFGWFHGCFINGNFGFEGMGANGTARHFADVFWSATGLFHGI